MSCDVMSALLFGALKFVDHVSRFYAFICLLDCGSLILGRPLCYSMLSKLCMDKNSVSK